MAVKICPLCGDSNNRLFYEDKHRAYSACDQCELIFVSPDQYLSIDKERSRYDLHQNSIDNIGYCDFLKQLVLPLSRSLNAPSQGLDFGSGPEPVFAQLMMELGHEVAIYDPYYHPDEKVFKKKYQFITLTEVIEHLHNPLQELTRLYECLKPGGWMGVMTALAVNHEKFGQWYYKNDLTHVCFYSKSTFAWIERYFGMNIHMINDNVIIMSLN